MMMTTWLKHSSSRIGQKKLCLNGSFFFKKKIHKIAVIGGGPSGFFAIERLFKKSKKPIHIDLFERYPVPYGLMRYGVAPDHPEVTNGIIGFEEMANNNEKNGTFKFIGNISVGEDISLLKIKENYDSILFSYGASYDKKLNIPGEDDYKGIISAREFIGWYNSLPKGENSSIDSNIPDFSNIEEVAIIGQGNVSLDIARILLTDVDTLSKTDISIEALDALSKSKIKKVHIIGRRGPMQASFTNKELRELMNIPNVYFNSIGKKNIFDLNLVQGVTDRRRKRMIEILKKGSISKIGDEPLKKSWSLNFFLSPKKFISENGLSVSGIEFNKTKLISERVDSPSKIELTGQQITIPAQAVFKSIGYKGLEINGMKDLGIQFNKSKGIIVSRQGRVLAMDKNIKNDNNNKYDFEKPIPGLYVTGWIATGATGTIATTMMNSFMAADTILSDLETIKDENRPGFNGIKNDIQSKSTSWVDWEIINAYEREHNLENTRPRTKITSVDKMLQVIRNGKSD